MNKIVEKITAEITENGGISFARFMELALYCPGCGYYETERDRIGHRGDFFTSVSVGSLFGELLAFQFAEWLEGLRTADCGLRIVEAGAHDGRLAGDILNWLREWRGEIFGKLEYCIVEPSVCRKGWQKKALAEFANSVRWVSEISTLAKSRQSVPTIIFNNELLDAMPVHRFGWNANEKKWFEWGVALEDGAFVWTKIEHSEFGIRNLKLEAVLPDGFVIEISPAAENWWREAASSLQRGKLLAIDYGLTAEEFYAPERCEGTLRAYHRHHLTKDLLANPGEQDITAHVNFTAIRQAGEAVGLKTEALVSQEKFLANIVASVSGHRTSSEKTFSEWTPPRARQFQTLTHPEHLGRSFRVLIQSR